MPDRLGFVRIHITAVVLVLATVVGTSRAHSAEPAEIEGLIRQGVAARRAGNDTKALPFFQKAHELAHTPRTAAQLGLVELALGYSTEAERHLLQSLAASKDPWVERNRATLEDSVNRARLTIGELAIDGSPVGAEVVINGKSAGNLPLSAPVRIGQGPATVELRATGYAAASAVVEVRGGKRSDLNLRLEKMGAPAQPLVLAARPEPTVTVATPQFSRPARDDGGTRKLVGWLLIGGGVAMAGTGAILLMAAPGDCTSRPGFECARSPRSRIPEWALIGAGAAAAIGGGIVLFTRPSSQIEIGFGPSSISLRGSL